MAYVFFDTETTGLNSAYCQIVQFAAILSDDSLNEVERVNLRCRLKPHIVPSPGAMQITGIGPDELTQLDLPSNYEMAIQLRDLFNRWGPAVFIGHNSIGFDEGFLRQLFYQSLLPTYVTNTGGSSRADTLTMAKAYAAVQPDGFVLPIDDSGSRPFRLEPIARANGFGDFRAHDALADVEATLFIAQRMRQADSVLFDHLIAMGRKSSAETFSMGAEPVFLPVSENREIQLAPLAGLLPDPSQHARIIAVDLRHSPSEVIGLDLEQFEDPRTIRINGRLVFRRIAINNQPAILSDEVCGIDARELNQLQDRADHLRNQSAWLERISAAFNATGASYGEAEYIEEQIYDGFPSSADQRLMDQFHAQPWTERLELVSQFEDQRFAQLAQRLIAEHAPDVLNSETRERHSQWLAERLDTSEERPWLTRPAALMELDSLEATGDIDPEMLGQMKRYFDNSDATP